MGTWCFKFLFHNVVNETWNMNVYSFLLHFVSSCKEQELNDQFSLFIIQNLLVLIVFNLN